MIRLILLASLALTALLPPAHAGDVKVRNKSVKEPIAIWVAEYSVGVHKATRKKGPWKILPEKAKEWSKSKFEAGHERWIRYSYKKSKLKKEFTKSEWKETGGKTDVKSIGSFVGELTISDKKDKGVYKATNATEEWFGQAWAEFWDSIWGPISTAGDEVTIYNETGTDKRIAEYQKDIVGECHRLQGGSNGFLVPAYGEKTITKEKLDPGFTARMVYFRDDGRSFPEHKKKSYWKTQKNRTKNDGKSVKKLYLYVDKNGEPRIYNNLEWQFKQMGCELMIAAVDVAGEASAVTSLPDAVIDAIGLSALVEPLEEALAEVTSDTLNVQELKSELQMRFDTDIGDDNLDRMTSKLSKLKKKQKKVRQALEADCFCDDDKLADVEDDLKAIGLKIGDWTNLNPDAPGHFHQGFSTTTSFSYKALTIGLTQSFVTDWKGERRAFFTLGVSAGTSIEKTPKVSRSLGMEFYPNIEPEGFEGLAWDVGVSGGGKSYPFAGGASAFFGADADTYHPDLSKLVGVGLAVEPNDESPEGSESSPFSAAGGLSYTFPAN